MSGNQEFEERLMNIEMALANQERMLDDLNQVVIEQGKIIDLLQKQSQYLLAHMNEGNGQAVKRRNAAAALLKRRENGT